MGGADAVSQEVIERAILLEALDGATRVELWIATRTALLFASQERFRSVLAALAADGDLNQANGRWTTSGSGRERLARLQRR